MNCPSLIRIAKSRIIPHTVKLLSKSLVTTGLREPYQELAGEESRDCSKVKQRSANTVWLRPGWNHLANITGDARAYEPVCRRMPSRLSRETAGLSGWPSSEPCRAGADGRVLQSDPSVCGTCSKGAPLCPNYPKQYRQRSCASEDWGARVAP